MIARSPGNPLTENPLVTRSLYIGSERPGTHFLFAIQVFVYSDEKDAQLT